MLRMPDKWIYAIECTNPEVQEDLSKDKRFNVYGWTWDKGYDSIESIGKLYSRGEAVDMVFNKHYTFVKYLATQYFTWKNGIVSFIKDSVLERKVMMLEEIWDKLPDTVKNDCAECYGSCAQCVYRKVDTEKDSRGQLVVKDIHCVYSDNELMQSLAKGNHYCKHFTCLHLLSKHNTTRC